MNVNNIFLKIAKILLKILLKTEILANTKNFKISNIKNKWLYTYYFISGIDIKENNITKQILFNLFLFEKILRVWKENFFVYKSNNRTAWKLLLDLYYTHGFIVK